MSNDEKFLKTYERQNNTIVYLILNYKLSKKDICKLFTLDEEGLNSRIESLENEQIKNSVKEALLKHTTEMDSETKKKVNVYLIMEQTKRLKEEKEDKLIAEIARKCKEPGSHVKLTSEERELISRYRVRNNLSRKQTCNIFNIPDQRFIYEWEEKITDENLKYQLNELNDYYGNLGHKTFPRFK